MAIHITRLDALTAETEIYDLAELLYDVVNDGASVSFLPPLSMEDAKSYWLKLICEIEDRTRVVLAAWSGDRIVGCVHLVPSWQPNAEHRAEIQKLLVHSSYRRRGIARQLLAAVEEEARHMGRLLLFLDTERYSAGEKLYRDYGFTQVGIIPLHSRNGIGELADTVLFYRWLQE